jgi:hypothetical protein
MRGGGGEHIHEIRSKLYQMVHRRQWNRHMLCIRQHNAQHINNNEWRHC